MFSNIWVLCLQLFIPLYFWWFLFYLILKDVGMFTGGNDCFGSRTWKIPKYAFQWSRCHTEFERRCWSKFGIVSEVILDIGLWFLKFVLFWVSGLETWSLSPSVKKFSFFQPILDKEKTYSILRYLTIYEMRNKPPKSVGEKNTGDMDSSSAAATLRLSLLDNLCRTFML